MPSEPPESQPLGVRRVYKRYRNLFDVTLPATWKQRPVPNAGVTAAFARERSLAWITISVGPVDLARAQYTRLARIDELGKLTWMEKERHISWEPFGPHENVARGIWTLDAGRDAGPEGSERWPVASRRGLISIVTGPLEHATEWVIQYRTQHDYIAEVTEIISSLCILNEQPADTTNVGVRGKVGTSPGCSAVLILMLLAMALLFWSCGPAVRFAHGLSYDGSVQFKFGEPYH